MTGAQRVQRRMLGRGAAVARNQMQIRYRYVELRVARVLQMQKLGGSVAQVERHEAEVAANAMLFMHHRIADFDLREILQHRIDVARLHAFAPR